MKVKFKDGSEEEFDANCWHNENCPDGVVALIKRTYDTEGDYSEDDDEEMVILNMDNVNCIVLK